MKILIELTKENIDLAKLEIVSLLKIKSVSLTDNLLSGSVDLEKDKIKKLCQRLSYSKRAFCPFDINSYSNFNTFKYTGFKEVLDVSLIKDLISKGYEVDLESPDITLTSYDDIIWQEITIIDRKQFSKRKNHLLPYSQPTSMHPKIARAMVNMAGSFEIYDPFAGSGGILIEAGLMGLKIKGAEIDKDIYEGLVENLTKFKVFDSKKILNEDGFKAFQEVNVVTDIPYGKSSKVTGQNYEKRVLTQIRPQTAVICTPYPFIENIPSHYKISGMASIYVHASLTRYIHVLKRQSLDN